MNQEIVNSKLIHYKSFFWSPDYIEPSSAWIEHIPFAFWFIEVVRPKTIVELGVHGAVSYFSFCQAIKVLDINTVCYGIDTWRGDEHAGFYTEEIFQKVSNHNAGEYSRFSNLIRSTFDEAKDYFIDGSIDLLHIDGLHSYEAVKHDFETWLPKLSASGYIIFHDINVRERNFGVFKLWDELKDKYAHFQFDFGHGLGIIAVGKVIHDELKELFNKQENYFAFLRNFFSERGFFFKNKIYNDSQLVHRDNQLVALNQININLDENLQATKSQQIVLQEELEQGKLHIAGLITKTNELEIAYKQLDENYKELTEFSEKLKEQNASLEFLNQQLQKKAQDTAADMSAKLLAVKDENEIFKKYINWYKSTYETRSLLGVIKEKLKGRAKNEL